MKTLDRSDLAKIFGWVLIGHRLKIKLVKAVSRMLPGRRSGLVMASEQCWPETTARSWNHCLRNTLSCPYGPWNVWATDAHRDVEEPKDVGALKHSPAPENFLLDRNTTRGLDS